MPYWFNVRTREVEEHNDPGRARAELLLGPYETRQEAQDALDKARARTEEWDEQDRRDAEWGSGDPDRDRWDNNPRGG